MSMPTSRDWALGPQPSGVAVDERAFMQWKTEPAGLSITRDRLAANAAFSPRTRSGNTERAYCIRWSMVMVPHYLTTNSILDHFTLFIRLQVLSTPVQWLKIPITQCWLHLQHLTDREDNGLSSNSITSIWSETKLLTTYETCRTHISNQKVCLSHPHRDRSSRSVTSFRL